MPMNIRRRALALAVTLAVAGCAPASPGASTGGPGATAQDTPGAATSAALTVKASITGSAYGSLEVATDPGAECSVEIRIALGDVGEGPIQHLAPQVAPGTGVLRWTYAAPRIPQQRGEHWVVCTRSGTPSQPARAIFDTFRPPMAAAGLTVHVTTATPNNVSFNPDPSLVPLRDSSVAKMKATLPAEWAAATRGLGSLQIVDQSADMTVFVLAGRGTSVNRTGADGSEDIVIFVSGEFGPKTVENVLATTLHELGHIWCCRGADADDGGHWKEKLRDPGLYGVDKFGLMTDPVTCVTFGAVISCPNRFSDREMRALGFTTFPPVTPDACVSQGLSLTARLGRIDASLTTMKAQIDANRTKLSSQLAQLRALEDQYPYGRPPAVFTTYESLRAQYNALVDTNNKLIDQYNAALEQGRSIEGQIGSLACDWS